MRVKKLMGIAVVLVALAVAVNALAFKTASVTNTATITVDTTTAAGLAITATGLGSGVVAAATDGYMVVSINQKVQPNSEYVFGPIFNIVNNNSASVTIGSSVTGAANGVTFTLWADALATTSINTSLGAAGSRAVYLKVVVPDDFAVAVGSGGQGGTLNSAQNLTITITATE